MIISDKFKVKDGEIRPMDEFHFVRYITKNDKFNTITIPFFSEFNEHHLLLFQN